MPQSSLANCPTKWFSLLLKRWSEYLAPPRQGRKDKYFIRLVHGKKASKASKGYEKLLHAPVSN